MPIEPVKIPQNVYIEDRIVGPLTLRQTLIMAIGGGFSYMMYASLTKTYGQLGIFVTVLVWIPAAIAVLFALVKVNDLSLMRICMLLFEKFNKSHERTWTPRKGLSINIRTSAASEVEAMQKQERVQKQEAADTKARSRIQELSAVLDQPIAISENEQQASAPAASGTVPEAKTDAASPAAEQSPRTEMSADEEAASRFPVDKSRISVDAPVSTEPDLSVFRDIFPTT